MNPFSFDALMKFTPHLELAPIRALRPHRRLCLSGNHRLKNASLPLDPFFCAPLFCSRVIFDRLPYLAEFKRDRLTVQCYTISLVS